MLATDPSTRGRKFWSLGRESEARLAVGDAGQERVKICIHERPLEWVGDLAHIIPTNTCGRAYLARIES
jgi:hypothetical protein